MANTLNIPEVTLAQVSDATHAINGVDSTGAVVGTPRKSVYQPIVVRITDHADNDASETGDDTDKMALFKSQHHGQPFRKDYGTLEHLIWKAANPISTGTDGNKMNIIYPNFDYSTFE